MARHKDWSREEHILVFNLYCKISFGRMYARNPEIIELAKVLGRSPNAVALKLSNFARLDPELQARGIKGMSHGAKGEAEVWREFEDNPETLAFESERLLAQFTRRKLEEIAEIDERELPKEEIQRERMVRVRVNQHFFRAAVELTTTNAASPVWLFPNCLSPATCRNAERGMRSEEHRETFLNSAIRVPSSAFEMAFV